MRIGVIGAAGRMGQAIIRQVSETAGCQVSAACEAPGSPAIGRDAGACAGLDDLGIEIGREVEPVIAASDCVIEFTLPQSTMKHSALTANAGVPHVIGTTGIDDRSEAELRAAGQRTALVYAPNMSLAVNLLIALTRQVAATLDEAFDIEILEMHHRHKIDAPSGTAVALGRAAAEGRGADLNEVAQWTRHGVTGERKKGDIGFATLRGGNVVGDHTVIFAVENERLEISHQAQSRQIFARGAVHAALWTRNRKPGFYTMFDVLGIPAT